MNNKISTWSRYGAIIISIFSCDDEAIVDKGDSGVNTLVQFEIGLKEVVENSARQAIALKLSRPLVSDAVISLDPSDLFFQNFTTDPAPSEGLIELHLTKGQTEGLLNLTPVDNELNDGTRAVEIKLHNLPVGLAAGRLHTLKITVKDDDALNGDETIANFIPEEYTLEETNAVGVDYRVHFSEPVPVDSHIEISISSERGTYDSDYRTLPAAENDVISLAVSAGTKVISFKVQPVNNNSITGELKIHMTISETGTSIKKGNILHQVLTIKDDELAGKPRGYEVTAGSVILKKFLEYDSEGRVQKVNWQYYAPYLSEGSDTYYYENNHLVRISKSPVLEVLYHWNSGRIVKAENLLSGIISSYTEYEYDDSGNLGLAVTYHRQNDGSYLKGMWTVYLHFTDGNVYKSLTYQDNADPLKEPYLLSRRTYDNYQDSPNPFDMLEVLPTVRMQTKLPTLYRIEEPGTRMDLTYHMSYLFREDGLPEKRIATAPGDTQTSVYFYY